jgi:hypothetical protein
MAGTVTYEGACADIWYRFIRSSVLPLARITFCCCFGTGAEGGESAKQRIAVVCALNRNVSANSTSLFGDIVAVNPCRTRS